MALSDLQKLFQLLGSSTERSSHVQATDTMFKDKLRLLAISGGRKKSMQTWVTQVQLTRQTDIHLMASFPGHPGW